MIEGKYVNTFIDDWFVGSYDTLAQRLSVVAVRRGVPHNSAIDCKAIRESNSSEDVVDTLDKMINCIDYKMYILCSIGDGHECTEFVDEYQTCLSAVKLLWLHLYNTIFAVISGAHSTQDILNDAWFDFESMIKNANDTTDKQIHEKRSRSK